MFVRAVALYFILPAPASHAAYLMKSAQDQCGDLPEDFDGVGWKNKWRFKIDTHSTGCVLP